MQLPLETAVWKLVHTFVKDHRFSVVHQEDDSVHLVLEQGRRALYVRVVPLDIYWAQVVERDITESTRRYLQLMKHARSSLEVVNLYVTLEAPTAEMVSRAQAASVAPPRASFQLYALFFNVGEKAWAGDVSLLEKWGILPDHVVTHQSDDEHSDIEQIRADVRRIERERERKMLSVFQYGKPFLTYVLLAVNTVVYVLVLLNGGTQNIDTLIRFGAKSNALIIEGEWWRLISPLFLHLSHMHFLFNSMALYFLGTAVERIFGSRRFIIIYVLAGISGSVASFAFTDNLSAGASGAIFGCFGALLVFGQFYPQLFFRTMGRDILFFLGLNLALGFIIPNIDNYGHIGGLIGGYFAAMVTSLPLKRITVSWRALSGLALTLLLVGIFNYGYVTGKESTSYLSWKGQEYLREERLHEALETYEQLVKEEPDDALHHFNLGYVYGKLERWEEAEDAWKKTIALKADFPEAYYNLALISKHEGRTEEAIAYLKEAKLLAPDNDDIDKLLRELER